MHGQAIALFIMNKHTLELTHLLSERLVRVTDHTYTPELTKHCVSSHCLLLQSQQKLTVKLVQAGRKFDERDINCLYWFQFKPRSSRGTK